MVQWVGPFAIGVYVGILVDPWFRAWITQNQWARQARELEDHEPPQRASGQISSADHDRLGAQPADPFSGAAWPPDDQS